MGIGSANPLLLASAAADSDPVTRSLRFDGGSSLELTPSSVGDQSTFTIATWVKRSGSGTQHICGAGSSSGSKFQLNFESDKLWVEDSSGGNLQSSAVFRDYGAWYHICFICDTTAASPSATDFALYVNGEKITSFDTYEVYPSNGDNLQWNSTAAHTIGKRSYDSTYGHLVLADFYSIDGSVVTPVGNFIEDTGYNSYKRKAFDMSSYGGNSFHIDGQAASDATLLIQSDHNNNDTLISDSAGNTSISVNGNTKHSTAVGTPFDSTSGSSLYFDGSGDYIEIGSSSDFRTTSNSFNVDFWCKPDDTQLGCVFSNTNDGNQYDGLNIMVSSEYIYATLRNSQSSDDSLLLTYTNDDTDWHHVEVCKDGSNFYLFIDGTLEDSDTLSFTPTSTSLVARVGRVYGDSYPAHNNYKGYLYDFRWTDFTGHTSSFTAPTAPIHSNIVVIGGDQSGNKNHFSRSNIFTFDVLLDTPNKNYATLNPTTQTQTNDSTSSYDATVTGRITEGNLKLVAAGASYTNGHGTLGVSSGKWYFEWFQSGDWVAGGWGTQAMFSSSASSLQYFWVADAGDDGSSPTDPKLYYPSSSGGGAISGNTWGDGTLSPADGYVYGCAFDVDNLKMYFMRGGYWWDGSSWVTTFPSSYGGDITSSQHLPSDSTFIPFIRAWFNSDSGFTAITNFGQDPTFAGEVTTGADTSQSEFYYAPPEHYNALCSANFDDPIVKAHENFNTVIWTGDGATTSQNIDSGIDLKSDHSMIWAKGRSNSPDVHHAVFDTVREEDYGNSVALQPNSDINEYSFTNFTINTNKSFDAAYSGSGSYSFNDSSETYVAWNWKENASAGFDIVTWTGDSSSGGDYSTVSHSLGVAPEMIIAKSRTGYAGTYGYGEKDWVVYHKDLGNGDYGYQKYLLLNENDAAVQGGYNGYASPIDNVGSSNFRAYNEGSYDSGEDQFMNFTYSGTGDNYVAYLFASVEGMCKVGSYTGNGSSDGTVVYCGFRPAWVMVKRADSSEPWVIMDNKRPGFNPNSKGLYADTSADENDASARYKDFLSTGFKARGSSGEQNSSEGKYIFLAMAESPLKYANAR